jgi:hypothetical protein
MSVGFLADYETANSTIKRYWSEFPTGRINPVIQEIDLAKGYIFSLKPKSIGTSKIPTLPPSIMPTGT